jgi:polar amino acid transport system ATP-binding protein
MSADPLSKASQDLSQDPAQDPSPGLAGKPVLRLEAVRKAYGPTVVLADVDLDVPAHTVTALIGASG